MTDRRFRFGLVAGPEYDGEQWQVLARRTEELGYSTLLTPDGLHQLAPTLSAAVAASITTTLRVGTFVLACTVRPARLVAWEAQSLATLTNGRFELGIGTGNPWANRAAVDEIGMPETTPTQRLDLLEQTVEHLRAREAQETYRAPVMLAAGGPRALALAGRCADIVTFAHDPLANREHVKQMFADVADAAVERADRIEYSMNVFVVGDTIPDRMVPLVGGDLDALTEADSLYVLRGEPRQVADEIQRRRDEFGYSYVTVNALYLEQFAPVIEMLHGR